MSLVELFSAEGCGAAPPADAWISNLTADPDLWKRFVPVAFHVTHWDESGWKDPLASKRNTDRQIAYTARWKAKEILTPVIVMNGTPWKNWPKQPFPPYPKSREPAGKLSAKAEALAADNWPTRVVVEFEAPLQKIEGRDEIVELGDLVAEAATLVSGIKHQVPRGENKGKILSHDFVSVSRGKANLRRVAAGKFAAEIQLEPPLESIPRGKRKAFAVWVRLKDAIAPLQATGGWL